MAQIDDDQIRVIAHDLWEGDGAPQGRDADYWHRAVQRLSGEAGMGEADHPIASSQLPLLTPPVQSGRDLQGGDSRLAALLRLTDRLCLNASF